MKKLILGILALTGLIAGTVAMAASGTNIGTVAANVTGTLSNVAKLITATSYVVGMAMAVAAVVKFKAYKDAPTQVPIGTPIAMLFVAAALIFIPTVFTVGGGTLFGSSGKVAGVSGVTSFGATKAGS